jgi:replicative DNA helicase
MNEVLAHLSAVRNIKDGITGVPTGYHKLDSFTGGFQKSDFIVIGGRPGMGKTSLALNFAINAAIPQMRQSRKDFPSYPVAIFSLEMGYDQILERLLCILGLHDLSKLRTGLTTEDEVQAQARNCSLLRKAPLFFDESSPLSPAELRAKSRRLKSQLVNQGSDLGLIVVDYLQLMEPNVRHPVREQQIREISGCLKSLAKELKVPVIAPSQLNRGDALEPSLDNLRESGSIEQDADLVFFVVRPEVIKKDDLTLKGKAEIRIGKHRNGPLGTVHLIYKAESASFMPGSNFESVEDI